MLKDSAGCAMFLLVSVRRSSTACWFCLISGSFLSVKATSVWERETATWYSWYHSFSQSLHIHAFMYHFCISKRTAFIFFVIYFTQLVCSTLHHEKQENTLITFDRKEVHVVSRGQHVVYQSLIPLMNYSYGKSCKPFNLTSNFLNI